MTIEVIDQREPHGAPVEEFTFREAFEYDGDIYFPIAANLASKTHISCATLGGTIRDFPNGTLVTPVHLVIQVRNP